MNGTLTLMSAFLITIAQAAAAPAAAQPSEEQIVSIVATSDLDLSEPSGRTRLEQRLVVAAHAVCDSASASDLHGRNQDRSCREQVLTAARQQAARVALRDKGEGIAVASRR